MFNKYQHIERYETDEVEGIELGTCVVFPKLDGTNGSVWWDEELKAGSRNRELSLENDNQGFMAYVSQDKRILDYLKKYPTHRLFGEWLIPHTLKDYVDTAWRKFYIFDVVEDGRHLSYDEYKPFLDEFDLDYIAPIKEIINPTKETLYAIVEQNDYLCQPGKVGEGIVIKNYSFSNKYGRTTWAKIVRAEFKEKNKKLMGHPKTENKLIEHDIVEQFCTTAFIEKEYQKIVNEKNGWNSKYIPEFLGRLWHSFIVEESFNIIKAFKNPTIDFRKLNVILINKVKLEKSELF